MAMCTYDAGTMLRVPPLREARAWGSGSTPRSTRTTCSVNSPLEQVNSLLKRVNSLLGRVNSLLGRVNSLLGR
eukprot:5762936-Pyramimonas_sp.AAC.1